MDLELLVPSDSKVTSMQVALKFMCASRSSEMVGWGHLQQLTALGVQGPAKPLFLPAAPAAGRKKNY